MKTADKFYTQKYITMGKRRSVKLSSECRDCHNDAARQKYVDADPRPPEHVGPDARLLVRKQKPIPVAQKCKICSVCKPIEDFYVLKYTTRAGNDKARPQLKCMSCVAAYRLTLKYPELSAVAAELAAKKVRGEYLRVRQRDFWPIPETKTCKDCGETKTAAEFLLRKFTTSTGRDSRKLASQCIPCWNRRIVAKTHMRRVYPRGDARDVYAAMAATLESYRIGSLYWDAYDSKLIENPTIDHIIPVSRGGTNQESNFALTSKSNNSSKNSLPLLVWLAKRAEQQRAANGS